MHREARALRRGQPQPEIQGEAGHPVDAAVAGGHQGHPQTRLGQGQGFGAAIQFRRQPAIATQLIGAAQRFEQIEVEPVAHPHRAAGQGLASLAAEQAQSPRSGADQVQFAPFGPELPRGLGNGQGGRAALVGQRALDRLGQQPVGRLGQAGSELRLKSRLRLKRWDWSCGSSWCLSWS